MRRYTREMNTLATQIDGSLRNGKCQSIQIEGPYVHEAARELHLKAVFQNVDP